MLQLRLWPKQLQAFRSFATELLYGGAAGPGKSHFLRVAFIAWACGIPGLQLYLFRRKYRDLIQGHMDGPTGFRAMLKDMEMAGKCQILELEIRFQNGSRISLNHCQYEESVLDYKSIEFHVLGIEEATEFSEFQLRFLRSRVRMPDAIKLDDQWLIPKIYWRKIDSPEYCFPRVVYATNPGGPGHDFFRYGFVEPRAEMSIERMPKEEGGMLRQFIPGRLTDNPSINPDDYASKLEGVGSVEYVRMLLHGDWRVRVGSYFPMFGSRHVVEPFTIPNHWQRYGGFDWGYSAPFVMLWGAVSSGKFDNGQECPFPKNSIIIYREAWGQRVENTMIGKRLSELNGTDDTIVAADPSIFTADGGESIYEQMRHGFIANSNFSMRPADNDRISGWTQLRRRFNPDPAYLYIFRTCPFLIEGIQGLAVDPKNPEDVDTAGNDHAGDGVRYLCKARTLESILTQPVEPVRFGKVQVQAYIQSIRKNQSRSRI